MGVVIRMIGGAIIAIISFMGLVCIKGKSIELKRKSSPSLELPHSFGWTSVECVAYGHEGRCPRRKKIEDEGRRGRKEGRFNHEGGLISWRNQSQTDSYGQ